MGLLEKSQAVDGAIGRGVEKAQREYQRARRSLAYIASSFDSLLKMRKRVGLAGVVFGTPELKKDSGALPGRRRLDQSAPQVSRGRLGRADPGCSACGLNQPIHD